MSERHVVELPESSEKARSRRLKDRSIYPHWMQERVRWSDTDKVGHVNNLAYGAYCETGRTHFVYQIPSKLEECRPMLVIAQLKINYLAETHWPALIDIGTGIVSVGRTSCTTGQGLFDGERCVATAESVLTMIDMTTRKPTPIPAWVLAWMHQNLLEFTA